MGRHGQPPQRRTVPWELVGWGLFAAAVAIGAALWAGVSWPIAAFVALTGLVGLGMVVAMTMMGSRD